MTLRDLAYKKTNPMVYENIEYGSVSIIL